MQDEFVELTHKGRLIRLVPAEQPSKLARLVPRDTICGSRADLDAAREQLDVEMSEAWGEKWASKL